MFIRVIIVGLILTLLAACGTASGAAGNPANGKQLFDGSVAMGDAHAPACATCHAIVPDGDTGSGQSLSNMGNRAGARVPGQSAEEYLRTAITNPDAFLADGYQEGIMYRDYAQALTTQQIDDLVAYMLTLKSGQDHLGRALFVPTISVRRDHRIGRSIARSTYRPTSSPAIVISRSVSSTLSM